MSSAGAALNHLVDLTTTPAVVLTFVIVAVYRYYANVFEFFKKQGLRNPTPLPLVGNLHTILTADRMVLERDWRTKYGKLYGIFNGARPRYVVSDPEVLRQICIKDFVYMPNHEASELLNDYQKGFLFFSQDDQWRRMRTVMSPTFTSGKIKRMYKLLDVCADDLVQNLSEQLRDGRTNLKEATVDAKSVYSLYTMDAITSAAYTIKLDRKANTSGPRGAATRGDFVEMALRLFEFKLWKILIAFVFPTKFLNTLGWKVLPTYYFTDMVSVLNPIVRQRQNASKKADDYLQILIDARLDDKMELDEMDEKENHHAALTRDILNQDQENLSKSIDQPKGLNGIDKKLSDQEIISSAIFLLIVGTETTASLLTNCSYVLAFHQDIQARLRDTIKQIAKLNQETGEYSFDYEQLTSCEYLDAVISETLRVLSPVISLDRVVSRDYHLEKYNVQLKKGDKLNLAFYAIMSDPEYWPEPLKFDPERFMGDNKKKIVPGSYCPFGLGPRHCLGMRFSLTEAKLALAKVLIKFHFSPAPGTKFPPQSKSAINLNSPRKPFVQIAPI